jgi:hypothetical protein
VPISRIRRLIVAYIVFAPATTAPRPRQRADQVAEIDERLRYALHLRVVVGLGLRRDVHLARLLEPVDELRRSPRSGRAQHHRGRLAVAAAARAGLRASSTARSRRAALGGEHADHAVRPALDRDLAADPDRAETLRDEAGRSAARPSRGKAARGDPHARVHEQRRGRDTAQRHVALRGGVVGRQARDRDPPHAEQLDARERLAARVAQHARRIARRGDGRRVEPRALALPAPFESTTTFAGSPVLAAMSLSDVAVAVITTYTITEIATPNTVTADAPRCAHALRHA